MSDIPSIDCRTTDVQSAVQQALRPLVEDGVVHLQGAFSTASVAGWREQVETELLTSVHSGRFPYRIRSLGEKREHYILEIHRRFASPDFYANPFVLGLSERLLEEQYMLVTVAIAYSKVGSGFQRLHRDQPFLFSNPKLNLILPPTSLTVCIPLCPLDDSTGGTEFCLRSHREMDQEVEQLHRHDSAVGDCMIWDSRILHRGRPNIGQQNRPIVLLYYQRSCFFNFINYSEGSEIKITERNLARVPEEHRHLFTWARHIWPAPQFESDPQGNCSCGSGLTWHECHGG